MAKSNQKGKLYYSMQAFSSLPLLILGLVIMIFSFKAVQSTMYEQVHTELQDVAKSLIATYDLLYPGDYFLQGEDQYQLVKGDTVITSDYSVIDRFKEETDMELTIFYQDTRILTTIMDENNRRIVGTGANELVFRDVFVGNTPHFYTNTTINGVNYFAYYMPLCNSDGTVVGMAYAGKPCAQVNKAIQKTISPILLISLFSILIVCSFSSSYTHKLLSALQKIKTFLANIASGNLNTSLSQEVLSRNDELSDIGISALSMQRSLRTLLEQDTLTGLNNRRFADKKLKESQDNLCQKGIPYVLCIGDIDHFKIVNDTYGHECGDEVLKAICNILKKEMQGKGYAARWGGEEFLLLYENTSLIQAKAYAEDMLNCVRSLTVNYEDTDIHVTMTLGMAQASADTSINELLKAADSKLYLGKNSGRNCIITG